jgi:hypothetical protein
MDTPIIAIIISLVSTIISVFAVFYIFKLRKRIDILSTGFSNKNLEDIIKEYVTMLEKCEGDMEMMNENFDKLRAETAKFFNKVGLVRFQAFKDTGGDQSFALALLNENNNGFLISSLHGRGFAKIYAKEISNGKSPNYKLTDEEENALKQALEI